MGANGLVRIRMEVAGLSGARAAMRGLVAESQRTDQAIRRSHDQTERARQRATAQTTAEQRRLERERERDAKAAGARIARAEERDRRERLRAERKAADQLSREQRRHQRAQEREMRRQLRTREREQERQLRADARGREGGWASDQLGGVGSSMAGAVGIGAVTAGITAALSAIAERLNSTTDALERRAGVQDIGERTASAQDFELAMARSSGEFFQGQSPEEMRASISALREEIAAVAVEAGQSPNELLEVLSTMQTEFSQFDEGRANLRSIALEAQRTGADMQQLARFVGVVNNQLGDSAPTAERMFDIMAQQGLSGAITPEQLAAEFGGMFGQFRDLSGLQGEDALRQFGAIANALKTKDMGVAETATLFQNLFTALGNTETRGRLQEATGGRRVRRRGADGRMQETWEGGTAALRSDGTVDFMQLIEDMSRVEGVGTSDVVFHDAQARQAAGQLVALQRRDRAGEDVMTAAELAAVSAESGAAFRATNLGAVMGTGAVEAQRMAALGQVEGIRELSGRESMALDQMAFREAARQTGADGMMGALSWLPFGEQLVSAGAGLASNLTGEQRAGISGASSMLQSTGIGGAMVGGKGLDALLQLAQLGDRQKAVSGAARGEVALAQGTRVALDDATIDRLASRLGTQLKGAAPTAGRTPGEPRR